MGGPERRRAAQRWGRRAEWIDYHGPDAQGKTVGIALFDHPANPRYPTGYRDLCMLKLMLNSGLRASEVLNLTWHDVELLKRWPLLFDHQFCWKATLILN